MSEFIPPVGPRSTSVLFPRFETERNPFAPLHERTTEQRAASHKWLLDEEMYILFNPQNIVQRGKSRNDNWGGVYCISDQALTGSKSFVSPFSGRKSLYRSWLIEHDYQWDQQVMSGHSTEIVLEELSPVGRFIDVMAILSGKINRQDGTQQLVMRDEFGKWAEPEYGEIDDKRDYYIQILMELAGPEV